MSSGLWLRLSGSVVLGLTLQACVSDVDPAATDPTQMGNGGSAGAGNTGAAGSGAATGGNNTSGAGGGGGLMSDPTFGTGVRCPAPAQALMTDFTPVVAVVADAGADGGADAGAAAPTGPTANINFGDFTNTLSGSSFVYPGDGMYPVTSDVSGGNWHITGSIGNYSGFGFAFSGPQPGGGAAAGCYGTDASAYQGISFTIQGSVPMGNSITMNVGTSADDITHLWLNANAMPIPNPPGPPNNGRCIPAMGQYDGSCAAPSFVVPVTAEPTTITVMWAQLVGGRPAATVDPKEMTTLSWSLPAPGNPGAANAVTYNVDITIDDLRFIE